MIENKSNELTLIFHSDKDQDKKARAFVETLSRYKVKTLDLKREKLTETQLAEIAGKMDADIRKLVDATYLDTTGSEKTNDIMAMHDNDLLLLMKEQPMLINTPIIIIGTQAYQYHSAYDLLTSNAGTEGVEVTMGANREEERD